MGAVFGPAVKDGCFPVGGIGRKGIDMNIRDATGGESGSGGFKRIGTECTVV